MRFAYPQIQILKLLCNSIIRLKMSAVQKYVPIK